MLDELILDLKRKVNRNGKAQTHEAAGGGEDLGVDAHDFAVHVKEGAAGVAGVYCDVSLNKGHVLIARKLAAFCRHNTGGHGVVQAKGTADCRHPFADLEFVAVAHLENGQILGFNLHHGDIGLGVASQHLTGELTVVGEAHRDLVGAVDHMMIGENQTVSADDKARTRAALFRFLAGTTERKHRETETTEDFRMAFIKTAERIRAFDTAGFTHGGDVDNALAVLFHEVDEIGQLRAGALCGGCIGSNGGDRRQNRAGNKSGNRGGSRHRFNQFPDHIFLGCSEKRSCGDNGVSEAAVFIKKARTSGRFMMKETIQQDSGKKRKNPVSICR